MNHCEGFSCPVQWRDWRRAHFDGLARNSHCRR
jgi:hypothetical protein